MMRIAIRADAALHIGIGHVMRCLTLANELKARSHNITFICRHLPHHLEDRIKTEGHAIIRLQPAQSSPIQGLKIDKPLNYEAWLGTSWEADLDQTRKVLRDVKPDWLIVDHYALDSKWERRARDLCKNIMVIDDLANRQHDCDLLLDQTFGREAKEYQALVQASTHILVGSKFALLRPEFIAAREASLSRRAHPQLKNILISLGGMDQDNVSQQIIEGMASLGLPDISITLVLGGSSPHIASIKNFILKSPATIQLEIDSTRMADLMVASDLAIGAAGATSWERCCLGVPSIVFILAENQRGIAEQLEHAGAILAVQNLEELKEHLRRLTASPEELKRLTRSAQAIVDGTGCKTVADLLSGGKL